MARRPLLATYLAVTRPKERGLVSAQTAARPEGAVIWAVCAKPDDLDTVRTLARRLSDDGEDITIIATLPDGNGPDVTPNTRRATRAFLDHSAPQLVLWLGAPLDPTIFYEIGKRGLPCVLAQGSDTTLTQATGRRVPGLLRYCLRQCGDVLTVDDATTNQFIKAGANPSTTRAIGVLEDAIDPPSFDEDLRAELAAQFNVRPLWLAANVPTPEIPMIIGAYRQAARRAHRTLLILTPRNVQDAGAIADLLRDDGLSVACRHRGEPARDATQIYLAATDDGLGLWSRLSSITYLGGSLSDGEIVDPFIPALLGSAVLSGPKIERHSAHFQRLAQVNAVQQVTTIDGLGSAVERLLATDLAATQAHAAWDVTSRGADATNDMLHVIYSYLDQADH